MEYSKIFIEILVIIVFWVFQNFGVKKLVGKNRGIILVGVIDFSFYWEEVGVLLNSEGREEYFW